MTDTPPQLRIPTRNGYELTATLHLAPDGSHQLRVQWRGEKHQALHIHLAEAPDLLDAVAAFARLQDRLQE